MFKKIIMIGEREREREESALLHVHFIKEMMHHTNKKWINGQFFFFFFFLIWQDFVLARLRWEFLSWEQIEWSNVGLAATGLKREGPIGSFLELRKKKKIIMK